MINSDTSYLPGIAKLFIYYKQLGERTFSQLNDEALHIKLSDDANSISIIVKHLVGNMLSRFTNFLTEDGEKSWRDRDAEFIDTYNSKEELLEAWEKGWQCVFDALNHIENHDLEKRVYIRNEGHTISEALNRQLAHYAYHVGQIVLLGKIQLGKNWRSLTIPKGQSENYNLQKFSIRKGNRHFTDLT